MTTLGAGFGFVNQRGVSLSAMLRIATVPGNSRYRQSPDSVKAAQWNGETSENF